MSARPWRVFVAATEPSGDALGAGLMAGLVEEAQRRGAATPEFSGIGGSQMRAQGLESLIPLDRLAVMGVTEVVPRLPSLAGALRHAVRAAWTSQPDLVVTIDGPDFNFRLQKALARRRARVGGTTPALVHYVAPTVWAWRRGRARRIARFLDHLLTLLPFEPAYFQREGLPATFVGHPVVAAGAYPCADINLRSELGIPDTATVLCILPGSRAGELVRHLPVYRDAVHRLANDWEADELHVIMPTLPDLADRLHAASRDWPLPVHVLPGGAERRSQAFRESTAALATSGTVALETAVAGLPTVVAYRTGALTASLLRRLVRVRYVHLVNIVAGRAVIPEYLQAACRGDALAPAVHALLTDAEARRQQIDATGPVLAQFRAGAEAPGQRAAREMLTYLPVGSPLRDGR